MTISSTDGISIFSFSSTNCGSTYMKSTKRQTTELSNSPRIRLRISIRMTMVRSMT